MTELVIIARITAQQGHEAQLATALAQLAKPTRQECGCLKYEIYQHPENKGEVLIYELWESHAHWRPHVDSEHLQAFKNDVLAKYADMTVEKLISAT